MVSDDARPRSTRSPWRPGVGCVLLAVVAACTEASPPDILAAGRDSAGIRVVTSAEPAGVIRLAPEPEWIIGGMGGRGPYQFERLVDPHLLADGGMVVADRGASEVRYFGASGEHVRTVGRRGEGPGEFRSITLLVRLPGDSALVVDAPLQRYTWLAPSGEAVRFADDPRYPPYPLADGRVAVTERTSTNRTADGSGRDTVALVALRPGDPSSRHDTLAVLPADDYFMATFDLAGSIRPQKLALPYGRARQLASGGGRLFTGDGETFEVVVLGRDGAPREIWRRAWRAPPLTEAHLQAAVDRLANSGGSVTMLLAEPTADAPVREVLTAYDRLLATAEGDLWARHTARVGAPGSTWSAFDRDGAWVGDVTLPGGLTLHDVRGERILVSTRDDFDVPSMLVYRWSVDRR